MSKAKKLIINNKTKIFILAPANTFTGGPECLHQLAFHLKKVFKAKTYMVYLPTEAEKPIHKNFLKYKTNYSKFVEDNNNNILILPEQFYYLKYALRYKKINKVIWWLSVDNFFGFKFREDHSKFLRSLIKIPYNFISLFNRLTKFYFGILTYHDYLKYIYNFTKYHKQKEVDQAYLHLMQSQYAFDYFKDKFKNIKKLYDYQSDMVLKKCKEKVKKKNEICYSHKSNKFIDEIKKVLKFKFIALKNMSANQVINIFKKTKIYLDFGYHPGKDKMPREAVLFNNCVITNLKGSAKNTHDIPIPKKFKFNENNENIKKISKLIELIFKNYKKEIKLYKRYQKKTLLEKQNFKKQLFEIFIKS